MKALFVVIVLISAINCFSQDTSKFKLFKKSNEISGFGGLTLNLLNGDYFLVGGEGAGMFGNYYFGGFGFSGDIGTYIYPLSNQDYLITRSSGGLVIGGMSNTTHIFALYSDIKVSFDQYAANSVIESVFLPPFSYRSISLIPSIGIALRPISFLQIRLGAGYNQSGIIDDGGLINVPYRSPLYNFSLTFGRF